MIFDLIFAIVLGGLLGYSSADTAGPAATTSVPVDPDAGVDGIVDLALDQLACTADPDPTPVLRAMMKAGMIAASDRVDFESFSCFEIHDSLWLDGIFVNSVCGGVFDPTVNAENPDLYPPNEKIADLARLQVIAFGSDESIPMLTTWYRAQFGHDRPTDPVGVIDGLYVPPSSMNEVFCDNILAYELAKAADMPPTVAPEPVPMDIPSANGPVTTDMPPPALPPPALPPPSMK